MTDRRAIARELRESSTMEGIADELEVSVVTVSKWLNPAYARRQYEAKQRWRQRRRQERRG